MKSVITSSITSSMIEMLIGNLDTTTVNLRFVTIHSGIVSFRLANIEHI